MSLTNLKKMQSERGFTIVELLIVIVVIGILAAIVIVAYNGIQNRANTTARNSSAENLAKKIEAYNSVTGSYPAIATGATAASVTTTLSGQTESTLTGSGITIGTPANTTAGLANGLVQLKLCTSSALSTTAQAAVGYVIFIWDSTLTTPGLNPVQSGGTASAVVQVSGGGVNTGGVCTGTTTTLS